jgi:hypothetical protein
MLTIPDVMIVYSRILLYGNMFCIVKLKAFLISQLLEPLEDF